MRLKSKMCIAIALSMLLSGLMTGAASAAIAPDPAIMSDLQSLFVSDPRPADFPYQTEMAAAAARHHLPLSLVTAVARGESFFDPRAVSSKGAVGIMQIMPATAADYGVTRQELFDPAKNIDTGVRFLADLYDNFKDPYRAVGAYYCGANGVGTSDSAIRQDCDDYVRYIHSHLRTILAGSDRTGTGGTSAPGESAGFVLASFDNMIDAENFRTVLSGKLPDLATDLFRREVPWRDHSRHQYQVLASYRQEDGREQVCREVEAATGFSFCRQ